MIPDKANRARRTTRYINREIQLFDESDYVENPPMVRHLNQERVQALANSKELKEQLEDAEESKHELELQRQALELRLTEAKAKIEQLNEEKLLALKDFGDLDNQLETVISYTHELELQKQALELKLDETKDKLHEASRRSFLELLVTVLAAAILGIGVNLATSKPYTWVGWVMIAVSIVLELTAFLIAFLAKPERATHE